MLSTSQLMFIKQQSLINVTWMFGYGLIVNGNQKPIVPLFMIIFCGEVRVIGVLIYFE